MKVKSLWQNTVVSQKIWQNLLGLKFNHQVIPAIKKKPQITLNGKKKKCINLSASEPAGHCIADAMHRPRQILPPSPRCIERNGPTIYVSGETEQWSERRDFTAHVMH